MNRTELQNIADQVLIAMAERIIKKAKNSTSDVASEVEAFTTLLMSVRNGFPPRTT